MGGQVLSLDSLTSWLPYLSFVRLKYPLSAKQAESLRKQAEPAKKAVSEGEKHRPHSEPAEKAVSKPVKAILTVNPKKFGAVP